MLGFRYHCLVLPVLSFKTSPTALLRVTFQFLKMF